MKQFKAYAQSNHLMDIMTTVNDDIARAEFGGKRMMPIQVSTLTKFVFFKMATFDKVEQAKHVRQDGYTKDVADSESNSCPFM